MKITLKKNNEFYMYEEGNVKIGGLFTNNYSCGEYDAMYDSNTGKCLHPNDEIRNNVFGIYFNTLGRKSINLCNYHPNHKCAVFHSKDTNTVVLCND